MWLRNWDNIQLIKMCGKVEDKNTTVFDDTSRTLKDYEGNIFTGNMANFVGIFDGNAGRYSLQGQVNSSLVTGGNFLGVWSNSQNLSQLLSLNSWIGLKGTEAQTNLNYLNSYSNYCGISLFSGSGATEVTYDDYCLESENTSLVASEIKKGNIVKDIVNNKWKIPVSRTFTNGTLEDIIISELGIYLIILDARASSSYTTEMVASGENKKAVLVYREVLPTPITLKPSDYQTFTIELLIPTNG